MPGNSSFSTLQIGRAWFPEIPGGLDRVYYNLVSQFSSMGIAVSGLVVGTEGVAQCSCGQVNSFARVEQPLWTRLKNARGLVRRTVREKRPQIVGSHFALFAAPGIDLLTGIPLVIHFHGPWADELAAEADSADLAGPFKYWTAYFVERMVYRRGAKFVVLSKAFANILMRKYRIPEQQIAVIPGGVNLEFLRSPLSKRNAREALSLDPDRPTIVSIRRLARRMGLELLIDAMSEVRRRVPDVLLLIGGAGPLHEELQSRIDEGGLTKNASLLGRVNERELALLYRAADFTIVPSVALEGFGLTTLESLASGTPVLVTPVGGLPEVVQSLSSNLILAGASKAAIAEAISESIDGSRKLPCERECTAHASAFTWKAMAEKTASLYRGMLS